METVARHLRRSPRRVLHQDDSGDVKFLGRAAIDLAHLRACQSERFRLLHDAIILRDRRMLILLTNDDGIQAPGLVAIPVPGHTRGSAVLLDEEGFLFTGDHLAHSPRLGHLYAFRDACWHSWTEQIRSMEKLRAYAFAWVLPGHGRRGHGSREEMASQLDACIAWMKTRG